MFLENCRMIANFYHYQLICYKIGKKKSLRRFRMKKEKVLRVASVLLIVTGIILLALPYINQWRVGDRSEKNHDVAIEMSAEQMQENMNTDTTFDFDSIDEISVSGAFLSPDMIDPSLIIGRLYIPSIDINLTVFNGLTNYILHAGLGTMRPNVKMGEGNFPIAGHYSRNKDILFGNLGAIEIGDEIYLTDNETVYEYHVYETRKVMPSEVNWIKDEVAEERGVPVISLMNCFYENGVNSGLRYFVFGELVATHSISDSVL